MAAGRRRTAQATVLFSALLCAVELLTDANALWEWIREGRWTPAAALIAAIVVAGAAQLAIISGGGGGIGLSSNTISKKNNNNNNYGIGGGGEKNWPQHRHQSAAACVRALLVVLRVSWMDEAARALLRPTYVTLHPRFLRPDVLLVDAALKALPQGILQLALSMQSNNINHDFYKSGNNNSGDISPDNEQLAAAAGMTTTTNNIIGSPSTGALSVATAALAIGHAMAVHEVGNFKQRQILAPVTSTSTTFLALLAFRACEAAMRMILLTVAVTGVCGAVVTALIVTMEVFGIIILRVTTWRSLSNAAASTKNKIAGSNAAAAKGPRRHRSSSLHWVWSVLAFVYIDHKIDRKVVISAEEGGGIRGRRGTATSAAETGVGWNQRIASLVDARLYYSIRALQCIFAGASVALLNHGLFAGLPFLHAANTTTAATTYTTTITSTLSSIIITATNLNHYYTTTTSDAAAAATAPAPLPLAHQVAWCLLCLFMVCLFPSVYRTHWRPPTRLGRHSRQRQQRHGKNNVNSNSSNANASNRTSLTTPVASLLSATSYTSPFSQASSPFTRYLTPESLHLRQAFTGALSPSSAAKSRHVVNELLQSPRLARRRRLVAGLHSNASEATTIGGVPTAMPLPVSRNPFHQRQHKQRIQTPSYPSSHQSPSGGGINDSGSSGGGGGGVVVGGDGSVEDNLDPRVTPMAMVMASGSSKMSSLLLSTGRTPRRQAQRLQTPSYLSSHQRRQSPHGVLSVSRIGTPLRRSSQLRT